MLYLNDGQNVITATLYEKSTITQPYYTWHLQRKGTFEEVVFYQDDSSYAPWYWNSFTVSVGTVSGLTQGQISLNAGEWTYEVWQMNVPYDLSWTSSNVMVESGILIVNGTYSPDIEYDGNDDSTIIYYKNM